MISQTMQEGDILSIEFCNVLQEVKKYCKIKFIIRNPTKTKIRQITKEQQKELPEHRRKEGKEDFLRKIANTSDFQDLRLHQPFNK